MLITDYTSYAEVRAALGLNIEELPDSMLALELYSTGLQFDLEDVAATLPSEYVVIAAIALLDRSAAQQKLYLTARQFATYASASQFFPSLPLLAAKTISDGKAAVTRDAAAPFKQTIEACRAKFQETRQRLEAAYATLHATTAADAVQLPLLFVVAPSTNPVTG